MYVFINIKSDLPTIGENSQGANTEMWFIDPQIGILIKMLAFITPESGECLTKFISQLYKFSSKIDVRVKIWNKSCFITPKLGCPVKCRERQLKATNLKKVENSLRQQRLLQMMSALWKSRTMASSIYPLTGPSWMLRQAIQLPGVHDLITRSKTTHLAKQKAQMHPCCSLGGLKIVIKAVNCSMSFFGWLTWLLWVTGIWNRSYV